MSHSTPVFHPVLSATPSAPPTYNVGIAETFSWIPVQGADRPLYAQATYIVNPGEVTTFEGVLSGIETDTNDILNTLSAFSAQNSTQNSNILALNSDIQISITDLNSSLSASQISIQDYLSSLNVIQNTAYEQLTALSVQIQTSQDSIQQELSTLNTKLDFLITNSKTQLGQNGFDFIEANSSVAVGSWNTVTVVSAAVFNDVGATDSSFGNMGNYRFPITFTFSGPITSIDLDSGAVIAYK